MTDWRDSQPYPVRAGRWVGAILLAIVLAAALAGVAIAQQAKKGAPPAKGAVRAQGQDVDLGGARSPAASNTSGARELSDPREQMRALIAEIGAYGRSFNRDFVVVTMGGLELLEKIDPVDPTKRAPAVTYMRSIDGLIAREIYFHPPREGRDEIKTDERQQAELLRLADIGQKRGVRIWSMDYAKDGEMAATAIRNALGKSYVPFPVTNAEYRFDRLPRGRPVNENPHNIAGLTQVRNFLMLTDTSAWSTQEEFLLAAAGTNYDAVVVDVFHRGRTPLTPRTVDGLKYKKLGARRLVLAYMNIGEAESDRYYWKPDWREGSPHFIAAPTAGNPDKYTVQYADPEWRQLITGNTNSYLYGIVAQGFDGVVLDGVEAYRAQEGER